MVPGGSLIVSTRAPIGYVAGVSQPTSFNQGCRGLVPLKATDTRYFRYQLLALADAMQSRGQGSTFVELSSGDLASMRVACPPLAVQRFIADYLDAETGHIDALIAKRRRMIALLDDRAQAVISTAICPGSVVYRPDGRPAGVEGVRCVRLGALARIQSGLTLDEKRDSGAEPVTLPYLRVANVQDGWLDLDDLKEVTVARALADRCSLRARDVLMTEGGDPDKLGRGTVWPGNIEPCLHQNHIFAVRPDASLLPEYLALVTRTQYARAYFEMTASKTTGIASTSAAKIAGFCVPLPSLAEQLQVIRSIDERLTGINILRSRLAKQISLLLERRQALITAAVSGELDVPGLAA
jgi:type I restriction enzyme S subunit